jgi:osmoprotectant transport system ATP-binding protein
LKNKTIVLVTHDIREAFQLGDKILLMDKGKIIQEGTPASLLLNPADNFVSDFFEDQRMQLELNAVMLKDIWPHLSEKKDSEDNLRTIDDTNTIWETLDILSGQKEGSLAVKDSSSGEIRQAGYDSLFAALNAYKRNRYE